MAGVNKHILVGNLGKDPEVRTTENGKKLATFSIATSETFKDQQGNKKEVTDWHNIVIWGAMAEVAGKYLKKGSQVYLEGRVKTRSYEDKDGNKKYITETFCDKMVMLGGKKEGAPPPPDTSGETQTSDEDDLPF